VKLQTTLGEKRREAAAANTIKKPDPRNLLLFYCSHARLEFSTDFSASVFLHTQQVLLYFTC